MYISSINNTAYVSSITGTKYNAAQTQEIKGAASMDILEISPEAKRLAEIHEFLKDKPFIKQFMEEAQNKPLITDRQEMINSILNVDINSHLELPYWERVELQRQLISDILYYETGAYIKWLNNQPDTINNRTEFIKSNIDKNIIYKYLDNGGM